MLVFSALRLAGVTDRVDWLFAVASLSVWLLLPAYAVVIGSAIVRARALAIGGVIVVAAHLSWAGSDLRFWSTESPPLFASSFEVAAGNLAMTNGRLDDAAAALLDLDADVLVVLELTPAAEAAMSGKGVLERYPFRAVDAREGAFGSAIYSRYAVKESQVLDVAGHPMMQATIDLPTGETTLVAVHTMQPLSSLSVLREQLKALDRLAHRGDRPIILAGDFNATTQHAAFRALMDGGIKDAHRASGRGRARSWPADSRVPPFALIDHVLTSDDFSVTGTREADIPGSDHRAVVAELGPRE